MQGTAYVDVRKRKKNVRTREDNVWKCKEKLTSRSTSPHPQSSYHPKDGRMGIHIKIHSFFLSPGSCAPRTPRSGGRTGGRGTHFIHIVLFSLFWAHILHIVFFLHFSRVYGPWEVSHLFSREISLRMHSESCLGTPWGPSYTHICKSIYFCKG